MANSPDFVAHVLELMQGAGRVAARGMFGGHGIYVDGMIVGIVVADVLYLKTDAQTLPAFSEDGLGPFVFDRKGVPTATSYHRPPDEALESPAAMREWLRLALAAALRAAPRRGITSPAKRKRGR